MPDCCVDAGLLAAAGWTLRSALSHRERRRRAKFKVLAKLSGVLIGKDFPHDGVYAGAASKPLHLGADPAAQAALTAVQRYQDMVKKNVLDSFSVEVPSCSYGLFSFGGWKTAEAGPEAEAAVCDELKLWLQSAGSGAASAEECLGRLRLYRQLLMRPETFNDLDFLKLLAVVCDNLEEFQSRLQGSVRDCAGQLSRVLSSGRSLIESLLPVLLFAVTETEDSVDSFPSAAGLVQCSLAATGLAPDVSAEFHGYWDKDCGRILRCLLFTAHFRDVWNLDVEAETLQQLKYRSVLDTWLELRHKWMDTVDANKPLDCAGLAEHFQGRESKDVQQVYLDIFKHVDNVCLFLSMVMQYKRLANIAGDAAMYQMRDRLHHLLQEIEVSIVQAFEGVSKIMDNVRRAVVELSLVDPHPSARRRLWIERLQNIDPAAQTRTYKGLLDALQQVRFLSSEARMPALKASCRESLDQIVALTASQEFRQRCSDAPPDGALPDLQREASVRLPAAEAAEGQATALWSLARQLRLRAPEDGHEIPGHVSVILRDFGGQIGDVVQRLNDGETAENGNVCVVYCNDTHEYIGLYREGCEHESLDALGLGATALPATDCNQAVEAASRAPVFPAAAADSSSDRSPSSPKLPKSPKARVTKSINEREEEQRKFSSLLAPAVLPFFDARAETLTRKQMRSLVTRSDLTDDQLDLVFSSVLSDRIAANDGLSDEAIGKIVRCLAHLQEGKGMDGLDTPVPPMAPMRLRGLAWDGRRLRVLESLA